MRYLTPVASERRTHLTANGAVTLCGRAITNKWRRRKRRDDRPCNECRERAAADGTALIAPHYEAADDAAERAVPV